MTSTVFFALAAALAAIGWWARRNAPTLVSPYLDASAQRQRERVMRRGGTTCLVTAVGFIVFAVSGLG